jgi:hypothetical protein
MEQAEGLSVDFASASKLNLVDRLGLIANSGSIELNNGKNMDVDTAYQHTLSELGKLTGAGLLDIDLTSAQLAKSDVAFYIDSSEPTKNVIAWSITLEEKDFFLTTVIDDETGKLLGLFFASKKAAPTIKEKTKRMDDVPLALVDPSFLVKTIADYYGLKVTVLDTENKDKYTRLTIELSDGQKSVRISAEIYPFGFAFNI